MLRIDFRGKLFHLTYFLTNSYVKRVLDGVLNSAYYLASRHAISLIILYMVDKRRNKVHNLNAEVSVESSDLRFFSNVL